MTIMSIEPTAAATAAAGFGSRDTTSSSIASESGTTNEQHYQSPASYQHRKKHRLISSSTSGNPEYLPAAATTTTTAATVTSTETSSSLPHYPSTATNLSQNLVEMARFDCKTFSDSANNEQLADFDVDIQLAHEDDRLTSNNPLHFSTHLPTATSMNTADNPIRIFPSPTSLQNHHDLTYYNIPTTALDGGAMIEEKAALLNERYRGELSILEKYRYDLSRAQLKASSRTSALLAGFAMVALVELQYERTTPPYLLITLGVVTTLLVSVHLLALMMSTCILPYIEANGCTQDSPHIRLKFYIDLSWLFSTCIGLMLFLIEIGVIFFVKFHAVNYITAAYITTAMLVPVVIIFTVFSCLIHKNRFIHSMNRVGTKVIDLQKFLNENDPTVASSNIPNSTSVQRHLVGAGLQGVRVIQH